MKKIVSVFAIVACLALLLTACGDPVVGTWHTTIDGADGQMTLRRNGTGEIESNGITRSCTWEVEGDRLTVVQDMDGAPFVFLDNVSYVIEEGVLTVTSYDGSKSLTFEKE